MTPEQQKRIDVIRAMAGEGGSLWSFKKDDVLLLLDVIVSTERERDAEKAQLDKVLSTRDVTIGQLQYSRELVRQVTVERDNLLANQRMLDKALNEYHEERERRAVDVRGLVEAMEAHLSVSEPDHETLYPLKEALEKVRTWSTTHAGEGNGR